MGGEAKDVPGRAQETLTMKRWKLILAALVAVLVIIVVLQNTDTVATRLLFASVRMPLAMLLIVTFLLGLVLGLLLASNLVKRPRKQ